MRRKIIYITILIFLFINIFFNILLIKDLKKYIFLKKLTIELINKEEDKLLLWYLNENYSLENYPFKNFITSLLIEKNNKKLYQFEFNSNMIISAIRIDFGYKTKKEDFLIIKSISLYSDNYKLILYPEEIFKIFQLHGRIDFWFIFDNLLYIKANNLLPSIASKYNTIKYKFNFDLTNFLNNKYKNNLYKKLFLIIINYIIVIFIFIINYLLKY